MCPKAVYGLLYSCTCVLIPVMLSRTCRSAALFSLRAAGGGQLATTPFSPPLLLCSPAVYVSIRQQTSAYVRILQHTSEYTSAYVRIRPHTSAYVSIRQHTSAYVSLRQHTSAYVRIRQHTSAYSPPQLCSPQSAPCE
jgi:hypothetical protein